MKKLMVLDGNSIVNRAFYGVSQNLTTRDGQPTNAVFGFLAILNKLLDECEPCSGRPAHQCGVRLSGHPEQAAGRVRTLFRTASPPMRCSAFWPS